MQIIVCFALGFGIGVLLLVIVSLIYAGRMKRHGRTMRGETERMEKEYKILKDRYETLAAEEQELKNKYEEMKKLKKKYQKIAFSDHTTGLPNKAAFENMLDNLFKTYRKEEIAAVMYVDIDNFTEINETLGRSYGDELLIDVADRLNQITEEDDYLACFGGDEFFILTQNMEDIGDYDEKRKKVMNVFSFPFVLAMKEVFVSVSIGICVIPKDGKTVQAVLKNLDSALYAAKKAGKNTYCYFDENISRDMMDKIELQSQIRNGIANQEFVVYYQPQLDLVQNKVTGVEALLRWNHPTRGIVLPDDFLSVAEETGLILQIGEMVLRQVCMDVREWQEKGVQDMTVTVNISSRQFKDESFMKNILEILEEYHLTSQYMLFDVNEDVILENINYSDDIMNKMLEYGIKFNLDDFGTGYSSIKYLLQLPFEKIKLDAKFLDYIMCDMSGERVLSALIALLHMMEHRVVAEGIEMEEQAELLRKAGCDEIQGMCYSEPCLKEQIDYLLFQ